MRPTPIVNRHGPPTHRLFAAFFAGKGQGFAYLSGTHQPRRTVAAFDGRRVGDVVAQAAQSLLDPLPAAMNIADLHLFETGTALMFDDLHMGRRAWNAETGFGMWAACSLSWRIVA